MQKSNYQSAVERINKAYTSKTLDHLESVFTNLYNIGQLTASEFRRLDIKLVNRRIKIDHRFRILSQDRKIQYTGGDSWMTLEEAKERVLPGQMVYEYDLLTGLALGERL